MAEVLEPLKTEMVEKEDFEKLDLRVMEIVDCEEDDRSRAFTFISKKTVGFCST